MVLGRIYEVQDDIASVTSAAALLAVTLPADLVVEIIAAKITDVDNDVTEQFACSVRQATGTAAGGASVTPAPFVTGDTAASVTCLSASGAAITGLTITGREFGRYAAPLLVGWHWNPIDGDGSVFSPSAIIVVQTVAAITTSTIHVYLKFREIGG